MSENINVVIYQALNSVAPIYPILADVDEGVETPFAFYRIKKDDTLTKESVKNTYSVGVFVVGETFDQVEDLVDKMKNNVYELRGSAYTVSKVSSNTDYDSEDRKYVGELSFTIKKL